MHVPDFNMHGGTSSLQNDIEKFHVDQFRVLQLLQYPLFSGFSHAHFRCAVCPRDTHRRFDTLHKWCQEWPILSGITLTLIGLVGRCVPVPIYYFGLAKISIEQYSENWLVS